MTKTLALRWIACLGLAGLLAAAPAFADDWTGWRGPTRDGHSAEKGLAPNWTSTPPLALRIEGLGSGYGSVSVTGSRIHAIGNDGLDNEFVQSFHAATGKSMWKTRLGKVGNPDQQPSYPASRSTPVVEGNLLWALGSDGDLVCLNARTGAEVWRKQLRTDFGGVAGTWAYSETPLIDGDLLVATPGGKDNTLVALDKRTGALRWACAIDGAGGAAYSSPIVATIAGTRQVVQYVRSALVGVDARSGTLLWRFDRTADPRTGSNIGTPIAHDDGVYGAASLVGAGLATIAKEDGKFVARSAYFERALPSAIGGIVRVGDHGYGANGQTFICFDWKTGAVKWSERGVGAGSMVVAENRIYLRKENGEVAMLDASPTGYRERGRFLPDGHPQRGRPESWAYPALANGRLHIRDAGTLWVYDVREKRR